MRKYKLFMAVLILIFPLLTALPIQANSAEPPGLLIVVENAPEDMRLAIQFDEHEILSLIHILGLLSLNIGIFNLLPLPILDGGRIVIVLLEKLIGKKLSEKWETIIMMIGVALVVGLMVFVTWNDILRLF